MSAVCVVGNRLVVNSYDPSKAGQRWSLEGTLLRWRGGLPGDRQVVGVKPPIGPNKIYLHVGPVDALHGIQWSKEFIYCAT